MEFKISTRKSNSKKVVSLDKDTVENLIDLLTGVECTAVWSEPDQQYLRIHNIDRNIVNELKNAVALSAFS